MMREQYWQHGQPSKHCRLKVINAQRIWQPATAPGLLYWSELFHGDQMPAASPVISFISRSSSAPSLSTRQRTSWSRFLARMRSVHARTVRKRPSARILIDKEGYVLEDKGVAVSSFAWALKPALDLKLGSLGNWPNVEPRIIEHLDSNSSPPQRGWRTHTDSIWMSFLTLINGLCLSSVYPSIWLSHPHSRLRCFIISRPRRRLNLRC